MRFLELHAQPLSAIVPQNQSAIVNLNVSFLWNSAPNAINYKVTLATNATFTSNYTESPLVNTPSWNHIVSNPGLYFWRVIAYNAIDSSLSPTYTFTQFTPANSVNTSLWLKADAGIVLDASNKVQQWNDLSNNGYLITQSNATKRPTLVNNVVNGYPSLAFNGSQFLTGGDILDLGYNSRSFFVIGKMASSNQSLLAKSRAFNSTYRYGIIKDVTNTAFLFQSDNNTSNYSTFNTTNYAFYNAFVNRNTAKNHFAVNNTALGVNSFNSNLLFESSYRFLIGAYNNANDDGEVLMLNGNICEIILSDTYDSTEILKIKNYLKYKYSPPLTLGSDLYISNSFCPQTLTASAGFTNYLWSTGSTTATTSVNQTGQYWVRATDAFGFIWSDTLFVQYPTITPPPSNAICANGSLNWNTGLGAGFTHVWSTGATGNNITINQPGNFSVTVTGVGGCSNTSGNVNFTIDTYPITAFIGQDTNLCVGNTLVLQIGASQTVQYTWSNGTNSPIFSVTSLGNYPVSVIVSNANGCVAQDTILISVNGTAPTLSYQASASGCSNAPLVFNDQSSVPAPSVILSQTWSFSNGASGSGNGLQVVFPTPGFYQGELEVGSTGNCISRDTFSFFISPPPVISIAHIGHCSNEGISFSAYDTTGSILSNHQWSYNQGVTMDTIANPTHGFGAFGPQSCQLIAENYQGCTDTLSYVFTLNAAPVAQMMVSNGCELSPINFTNSSSVLDTFPLVNQTWNFGDGTLSTEFNPNHLYSQEGNYILTLYAQASSGCSDTTTDTLTVFPTPDLSWTVGPSCMNNSTPFYSTSTIPSGTIDSTSWIVNLQYPFHGTAASYTFTTLGIQFLHLTATSNLGCMRDTLILVEVNPGLTSGFVYSPFIVVPGTTITLSSLASGNTSVQWSVNHVPSGNTDTLVFTVDPNYLEDTISITCTTQNAYGCIDTSETFIVIENQVLDLAVSD
ncbi:MAG: PKD domain-containing protein, partial [Flavobacteriales bacterium]